MHIMRAQRLTEGGVIAGQYQDAQGVYHGFILDRSSRLITYNAPFDGEAPNDNLPQGTWTRAINSAGDTAGFYWDAGGANHGFIRYRNGTYAQIIPPGSVGSSVCQTDCLNAAGVATGTYHPSGGPDFAFVRDASGVITTISMPGDTSGAGINNANVFIGNYNDSNGVTWPFIPDRGGKTLVFQAPDASTAPGNGSAVFAINDAGAVTGLYVDDASVLHGFYRSQTGKFSEFDPSGSVATFPSGINASGEVTGTWYDAQNEAHGFIWMPH